MSMLLMVSATVLAAEAPVVNEKVKAAFNKEFSAAELVQWSEQGDLLKATFLLGGNRTLAYFSADGDLQGTIRSILYNQLPLAVMTALDKKFPGMTPGEISEISNSNGTSYTLALDCHEKKYNVRVDVSGNITDVDKTKK